MKNNKNINIFPKSTRNTPDIKIRNKNINLNGHD